MAERPILFSGAMVRAILAGQKTMTRRVVKWKPFPGESPRNWTFSGMQLGHPNTAAGPASGWCLYSMGEGSCWNQRTRDTFSPYGAPGDRLWVRETWGLANSCPGGDAECDGDWLQVGYQASGGEYEALSEPIAIDDGAEFRRMDAALREEMKAAGIDGDCFPSVLRWRPSIHMPRWASRLALEVTGVRVERLHAITDEDAVAEGITRSGSWWRGATHPVKGTPKAMKTARDAFAGLWQEINGERPGCAWDANPWVWVVSFKPVEDRRGR